MKVFNRAAAQVEYAANIQAWPDAANLPQLNVVLCLHGLLGVRDELRSVSFLN